ncbi:thermonuclease family protein [uncultured Flavobacterium sp.]|uniref:thermonuclease family protein n=1 Tax=uncultured Flavobacterium sp. TaxID=165435 RepID=UPI0025EEA7D3|nr:thermonuclease family protein [uncultured Flavobacterium sp.]
MANSKRRSGPGGLVLSLFLLAFAVYFAFFRNAPHNSIPEKSPVEESAKKPKVKKAKKKSPPRHLTVFEGKVIGIKDGDTFEVLYDSIPERVRLAEIDCPEKSQAFGKNARQYASGLCFGKIVTVSSDGKRDRYGRVVGTVTTQEGVNVNEELVKAGLAWHYKRYSKSRTLDAIEQQARDKKLGLWADKDPTAPWEWRKEKRYKK